MIGVFLRMLVAALCLAAAPAAAQQPPPPSHLADYLGKLSPGTIFPGADSLGAVAGTPPAAPAYAQGRLIGHVFLNSDLTNAGGYSGKPIHVVVGVDLAGTIVGVQLLQHSEPIMIIGVPEEHVRDFVQRHVGINVLGAGQTKPPGVDAVSGATVSAMVISDTIVRGATKLMRARGVAAMQPPSPQPGLPERRIDMTQDEVRGWEALLSDGSVAGFRLTVGEVNAAFAQKNPKAGQAATPGQPDATLIKFYTALVSAPPIGRSLLGDRSYLTLQRRLGEGRHAILVMGQGPYSWRGGAGRVTLLQDGRSLPLGEPQRVPELSAQGAPYLSEIALMAVEDSQFDPTAPWRLRLAVQRNIAGTMETLDYELPYRLPEQYLAKPPLPAPEPKAQAAPAPGPAPAAVAEPLEQPLWMRMWRARIAELIVVGVGLGILTFLFFFQDWLVKRPKLYDRLRTAFLAWTLVWLGWWMLAQLSVVNVLTLTMSFVTGFNWDYFLMEPLLFVLWSAVAGGLLFWGRGAFCGWLCPFGALQELANRLGRLFKLPQLAVPWSLHERLWPFKYIGFLGLFGLALYSLTASERMAEIEPFKTAIVLRFLRDWPFVVYAVTLLVIGLFIERFFCRYICPLGAALAIPARLRMFDWLKRHRECGNPCQRCAVECPVASIHPDGRINPNECIYCMHCQVLYWDEYKCPAMIQRRLRRERAEALSSR